MSLMLLMSLSAGTGGAKRLIGVDGGAGGRDTELDMDIDIEWCEVFDGMAEGCDGNGNSERCEDDRDNREEDAFETVEVEDSVDTVDPVVTVAGGAGASIESRRQLMWWRSTSAMVMSIVILRDIYRGRGRETGIYRRGRV